LAKERGSSRPTRATKALEEAFAHEAGVALSSDVEMPWTTRRTRGSRGGAKEEEEQQEEIQAESSTAAAKRAHKPQRGVIGLETFVSVSDKERRAMEKDMDLVTNDVGNADLFKRFNVGWVLPEGSKRKRAERPEPVKAPREPKHPSCQG
jgi:NuA3 HAT complex component NTO1